VGYLAPVQNTRRDMSDSATHSCATTHGEGATTDALVRGPPALIGVRWSGP
jgi:hypothetical protein